MAVKIHLLFILGAVLLVPSDAARNRNSRRRAVIPTQETLAQAAESLGAASYEETVDEKPAPSKRVQRKLPSDEDTDLDPQPPFMEYQGVMGRPGVDFPVLPSIPRTDFNCRTVKSPGYYADLDTGCQVFHICDGGRKISFLCPNGTIFRQSHLICDWWFRVDCGKSVEQYEESAELLAHDQAASKRRSEAARAAAQEAARSTPLPSAPSAPSAPSSPVVVAQVPSAPAGSQRSPVAAALRRAPPSAPAVHQSPSAPAAVHHVPSAPAVINNVPSAPSAPSEEGLQRVDEERARANHMRRQRPQPERERQVLAETASFTKQRHRFGATDTGRNPYTATRSPSPQTTNKPVFTIRVKPDREFSLVELHRQESVNVPDPSYADVHFVTSRPKASTPTYNSIPQAQKNSHSTPYFSIPEFTLATTELPPYYSHSLTIDTHLNDSDIDFIRPEVINSLMDTPRPGTPTPASAVKTLHSLASYYESNSAEGPPPVSDVLLRSHQPAATTETPLSLNSNITVLPSVLTKATQDSYSYLFKDENKSYELQDSSSVEITSETKANDISTSSLKKEQVGTKREEAKKNNYYKEIQHLKESTDLRELAQVFTRALSAYLEDPESFKEILAQVRPTEPNSRGPTTPSPEDEVLDFSDDNKGQSGEISPLDINNLASMLRNIEQENSIESSESRRPLITTTPFPTSIAQDINSFVANFTGELYSSLGSSEDKSYFPTAGGVSDDTRPRYGGFQNNSGDHKAGREYKPYGAGLPINITGAPLREILTTVRPNDYNSIPETLDLPEALGVNSLASGSGQPASEELVDYSANQAINQPVHSAYVAPPPEQENLFIASNTQSFINPNDYKYPGKDSYYPSIYGPYSFNNQVPEENKDYSVQADVQQSEPFTTYPTTTSYDYYTGVDQTTIPPEVETYSTIEPAPQFQQYTTYSEQYQNVDLGNGVTIERTLKQEPAWSVTTEEPIRPTTYHPTEVPFLPPEPVLEERAREMFGGLNASAAGHLMDMMDRAEQNTTIRKLVLLLVSDTTRHNQTVEQSRTKLIEALLTQDEVEQAREAARAREEARIREEEQRYSVTAAKYRTGKSINADTAIQGLTTTTSTTVPPLRPPVILSPPSTRPLPSDSDARAVELLKSLYNLAARWG